MHGGREEDPPLGFHHWKPTSLEPLSSDYAFDKAAEDYRSNSTHQEPAEQHDQSAVETSIHTFCYCADNNIAPELCARQFSSQTLAEQFFLMSQSSPVLLSAFHLAQRFCFATPASESLKKIKARKPLLGRFSQMTSVESTADSHPAADPPQQAPTGSVRKRQHPELSRPS